MAHPDLDQLLNALLLLGRDLLAKNDGLDPFGAAMTQDGTINLVAGRDDGPSETGDVVDLIVRGLEGQAAAGEIRAAGLCLDVLVQPEGQDDQVDAIHAELHHESGESVAVFLPYVKTAAGDYDFGELFAAPCRPRIFATGVTN